MTMRAGIANRSDLAERSFPKEIKVGIAFEGGGARGSFGWAVIEALKDAGIQPTAVSGTSAGALSAVAVAARKYSEGSTLYRKLKLSDVLPFRKHPLIGILLFVGSYAAHAYLRVTSGMNATHLERDMAWANIATRIGLAALMVSCFFWMGSFYPEFQQDPARPIFPSGILAGIAGLCVVVGSMVAVIVAGGRAAQHQFYFYTKLFLVAYPTYQLIVKFPSKVLGSPEFPSIEPTVIYPYLLAYVPILSLVAARRIAGFLSTITLSSNAPLRGHIQDLSKDGLQIDCFVTVASPHEIFDPDNPIYESSPSFGGIPGTRMSYPKKTRTYIPSYFNLKGLGADTVAKLAVASSALPFGIVPPEEYEGTEYVDGAMADNCPVRPLIDDMGCEILITIHLRPKSPLSDTEKHYKETWRRSDLLGNPYGCIVNEPASFPQSEGPYVPFRPLPSHWPYVISVMPDIDLGGLLDFRDAMVSRRLDEGRNKGNLLVEELFDWASNRK